MRAVPGSSSPSGASSSRSSARSFDAASSRRSSADGSSFRHDPYSAVVTNSEPGFDAWDNTRPVSPSLPPSASARSFFSPFPSPAPVQHHQRQSIAGATPPEPATPRPFLRLPIEVPSPAAALSQHCVFLDVPSRCPDVIQRGAEARRQHALFIGQVKFDVTPQQLAYVFKTLAGAAPSRVNVRGRGCFSVNFANAEDAARAKELNGRVLWEPHGVWYAPHDTAHHALEVYVAMCALDRMFAHMPRDTMVVRK